MERPGEVPILSGREGAGVSPGQHRRARGGSAVALPQGTIDSNLSTGQGRDPRWVGSFFGSGSSGYFKGHRPEHTLFHSLSLWRMICTYEYHRPVGTWIGVKSIAALIYNANVHSRGKTKMKWMAGNECTPRSPSQFFFPRGESFGNYTAKTVGRTDGRRVACSLHYMRELCNRSRTSERPRGRPELLPRARGGRNCSTRGSGNQVQAVQRPPPRPVMLGSVLSLAAGEATRFRLSSSSVSVTFFTVSASVSGTG